MFPGRTGGGKPGEHPSSAAGAGPLTLSGRGSQPIQLLCWEFLFQQRHLLDELQGLGGISRALARLWGGSEEAAARSRL